MSLTGSNTLRVVLYEGSNAQTMDSTERFSALTALLEKGFAVTRTVPSGRVAPHTRGSLLVLGKFGEGRKLEAEGVSAEAKVHFEDITGFDTDRIASVAVQIREETGAA